MSSLHLLSHTDHNTKIKPKTISTNTINFDEMASIYTASNMIMKNKTTLMWTVKDMITWINNLNTIIVNLNQKQNIIKRIQKKKIKGKDLLKCNDCKEILILFGKNIITESTATLLLIELDNLRIKPIMTQNKLIAATKKSTITKNIDTWSQQDLQHWISNIGLSVLNERKINNMIQSNGITGKDFNSIITLTDATDLFECIDNPTVEIIFSELVKYRKRNIHRRRCSLQLKMSETDSDEYANAVSTVEQQCDFVNMNSNKFSSQSPPISPQNTTTHIKRLITQHKVEFDFKIGDACEIYSESVQEWCDGIIEAILTDSQGKCYRIAYTKNGISGYFKDIPVDLWNLNEKLRRISDLKRKVNESIIITNNNNNIWKKGDKCDVYSSSAKKWCNGVVVQVFSISLEVLYVVDQNGNTARKIVFSYDENVIRRRENLRQQADVLLQKYDDLEDKLDDIVSELKLEIKQYMYKLRPNIYDKLQIKINNIYKNNNKLKRLFYDIFVTEVSMAFFDAKIIHSKFAKNHAVFENKFVNYASKGLGFAVIALQEIPIVATILDLTKFFVDKSCDLFVLQKAAKYKIDFGNGIAKFDYIEFAQRVAIKLVESECVSFEIKKYELFTTKESKCKNQIKRIVSKYSKYLMSLIATGEAQKVLETLMKMNVVDKYINILSFAVLLQSTEMENVQNLNHYGAKELMSEITNDEVDLIKLLWTEFGTNNFWKQFAKNALDKVKKLKT
eukprot:343318_1